VAGGTDSVLRQGDCPDNGVATKRGRFGCRRSVRWRAGRPSARAHDRHPRTGTLVFERLASVRLHAANGRLFGCRSASCSIERKTVSDLVGCCMGENRERFERELHRLRGYRFKRLLVVGSEAEILAGQYHSNIKPQAVLATVCTFDTVRSPGRVCADGAGPVEAAPKN
jgi:hypothetical protein